MEIYKPAPEHARLTPIELTDILINHPEFFPPQTSVDMTGNIVSLAREIADKASDKSYNYAVKELNI